MLEMHEAGESPPLLFLLRTRADVSNVCMSLYDSSQEAGDYSAYAGANMDGGDSQSPEEPT